MSKEGSSIKNLPPGKLQNLKKLFENKDDASGPTLTFGVSFGTPPPKPAGGASRPVSSVQPRPAPRHLSPVRKTYQGNGSEAENGSGKQLQTAAKQTTPGLAVPRPRQVKGSEKQEWSTLDRKSLAAAAKRLSPTVSRRVSQFSGVNSGGSGESGNSSDVSKPTVDHRLGVSPGARSGSPKRKSDPGADDVAKAEVTERMNSGDRRRTVDNVDLGVANDGSEASVSTRLKTFEKWSVSGEKPSLPKKPPPSVINPLVHPAPGSVHSTSSSMHKGVNQRASNMPDKAEVPPNDNYELPWDVAGGRNIERLKAMSGEASAPKPIPATAQAQNKQTLGQAKAFSPPKAQSSKPMHRPTEQPPPPPSKPPRTFAHDDYLKVKIGTDAQSDPKLKSDAEAGVEGSGLSVKERISVLLEGGSGDIPVVTLRQTPTDKNSMDRYSHLENKETISPERETKGFRETPPTRPPPPRPRPISEASALHQHHPAPVERVRKTVNITNGDSDSETDGPVVISLRHGGRIGRHMSVSGQHRHPDDQLPEPPGKSDSLQRFALRKSYSSECLNKGSLTSLSDFGGDDGSSSHGTMTRSYHAGNKGGEPVYEAVIDEAGYAVPNEFIRLPPSAQLGGDSKGAAENPNNPVGCLLKKALAPASSTSPLPNTTPVKDQDVEKVSRKKMNLVRQKINQAYELLTVTFHRGSASEGDQESQENIASSADRDSVDSDSIVDITEIKRRVTYCSTVRLKTVQSVKKAQEFMDRIYPQLFEYAVIVGLNPKTDDPGYDPYIIHKFPQTVKSNVSVPKFCFPDAEEFRPGTGAAISESYSFVLTNIDGARVFGYCRRVQPRDSSLPEVICIISPIDAFNMYNKLLTEIEARRGKSLDHAQEMIAASFGRPLPKPGKVCHIRSLNDHGEMETVFLDRPADCRLTNVNYELLLTNLGTEKLIKVFASMLMERRLILCSTHLSILTQTIHALGALLYPFHWQHVYIPILPADMLDVCASPTPFIIGILQSHLARVMTMELEDVIIVDLDKKTVLRSAGDEMTILPKKVQKALKTALNMCKIDTDARSSQWLMVSEAFLRMFVEMVGHFGQFISTQQDSTKTFQREQFVTGAPSKGIRQFLEWFMETQMFEVFITMQMERQNWGSLDLFMARLYEHTKAQTERSQNIGLGQRVKNIGKALKTKLKEAT